MCFSAGAAEEKEEEKKEESVYFIVWHEFTAPGKGPEVRRGGKGTTRRVMCPIVMCVRPGAPVGRRRRRPRAAGSAGRRTRRTAAGQSWLCRKGGRAARARP